ncbi:Endo-type membrane-bound lytic murein transglycosylase A [Tepidimonas thermarum]|uniref:Endo-type membrane-bound lytic murein transglycosylase A n=1 Tax=Tepidimonas thermarum TaxID=335431 RepID=A0A554WYU7_9BURK|nr:Endo-type membrane-bound lytic murein transglycosylase A [Tepidimonas thermarum]
MHIVSVVQKACVLAMFVTASLGHANGVWTYVDAQGVTYIGNVSPPPVKRLQWLAFDDRVKTLPLRSSSLHPARLPGYAVVQPLLESAAQRQELDPALVTAIVAAESGFRPEAVSKKGAVGLMQVMPATAQRYGVVASSPQHAAALLKNPDLNVQVGTRYLADLLRMFDGELELAIAAYNAGEGAVLRYGRRIPPFPETQEYVVRVMKFYRALTGHLG